MPAAPPVQGRRGTDGPTMRIGVLFNHDQIHQVAHALPVALAIARTAPDVTVVLATGSDAADAEIDRLADAMPANVERARLHHTSSLTRTLTVALNRWLPVGKVTLYRDNLPFFRSLDTLIVAEKTSAILRTRYGLDLPIIHTRHGAGDRAIGFDAASRGFHHTLVSGPKVRDRLVSEADVDPARLSVVGYPKFDMVPTQPPALDLPADHTTVLYNPHPSPALSSWFRHGAAVLDWFVENPEYNLIFAPHAMLFERPVTLSLSPPSLDRPGRIRRRWCEAPNILIDTGSSRLSDMTYTRAADVYLGDVSSQIYEFLVTPRPALFLNSHGVAWADDPNYAHWGAGPVIGSPEELKAGLARALSTHDSFCPAQEALFAASVDLTDEPSSLRAARAVLASLDR